MPLVGHLVSFDYLRLKVVIWVQLLALCSPQIPTRVHCPLLKKIHSIRTAYRSSWSCCALAVVLWQRTASAFDFLPLTCVRCYLFQVFCALLFKYCSNQVSHQQDNPHVLGWALNFLIREAFLPQWHSPAFDCWPWHLMTDPLLAILVIVGPSERQIGS